METCIKIHPRLHLVGKNGHQSVNAKNGQLKKTAHDIYLTKLLEQSTVSYLKLILYISIVSLPNY